MKLRTATLTILLAASLFNCKDDDDSTTTVETRDRDEVYEENMADIEAYLATHFYNYEDFDFDNPYSEANDTFKIVFDTIAGVNADKIPLKDQVISKKVQDAVDEDLEYTLYYLVVREGNGEVIHNTDKAFVQYTGTLLDRTIFDSTVTPIGLSLATIGNEYGVVDGFREAVIEFKTGSGNSENGDGTVTYHGHGIGAVFIPSGLGYFASSTGSIPSYSPIVFALRIPGVTYLDHDSDLIPSYLEDLDGDGDIYNDDTDGDGYPNALDQDDDGDGVLTRYEDLDGDGDPTNDIGKNGIPKYLDKEEAESNQA